MSLKGAREKKGVTQGKLSEPTGINLIMLSDYERGTKEPTLETMVKLEKEYKAGIARAQRKRVFPTLFPCLFLSRGQTEGRITMQEDHRPFIAIPRKFF